MSDEAGQCPRSKGRDGLRRTGHHQLSFVLADRPDGGGSEGPPDASEGRAFLLQRAKRKRSARTVAWAADTNRLLEDVASEANLALALLNVVRNEGAPGIDGQTVEQAEADAPKLLPGLRRALLGGALPAGDIPLGDRTNLVFQNTQVTRGAATVVVTATGALTQRVGEHL